MAQIGSASSVDVSTLLGFTRFLTNTLDNTAAFSDANITALLNLEYRETQSFLLSEIMYDWKENAVNGTGTGLINLVSGTNNYAFPTNMMSLDRLEINYNGGDNNWVIVEPVKLETVDSAISNTTNNSAIEASKDNPIYWVRDGYIYIDPIPDDSVTGGLKAWCTSLITDLAVGGSGDQLTPVFIASHHHLLCYEPAAKWLEQKDQINKANNLRAQRQMLRSELVDFYSNRQADTQARIKPKTRNYV